MCTIPIIRHFSNLMRRKHLDAAHLFFTFYSKMSLSENKCFIIKHLIVTFWPNINNKIIHGTLRTGEDVNALVLNTKQHSESEPDNFN